MSIIEIKVHPFRLFTNSFEKKNRILLILEKHKDMFLPMPIVGINKRHINWNKQIGKLLWHNLIAQTLNLHYDSQLVSQMNIFPTVLTNKQTW